MQSVLTIMSHGLHARSGGVDYFSLALGDSKAYSHDVRGQVSRRLELGLRFDCKRLHKEKLARGVDYLSISI